MVMQVGVGRAAALGLPAEVSLDNSVDFHLNALVKCQGFGMGPALACAGRGSHAVHWMRGSG